MRDLMKRKRSHTYVEEEQHWPPSILVITNGALHRNSLLIEINDKKQKQIQIEMRSERVFH